MFLGGAIERQFEPDGLCLVDLTFAGCPFEIALFDFRVMVADIGGQFLPALDDG